MGDEQGPDVAHCQRSFGIPIQGDGRMKTALRHLKVSAFAAALFITAAVSATSASAASSSMCSWPTLTQAFAPWGDSNLYFLAPDGNFQGGASGWGLSGGAGVVSGGAGYDSTDAGSLALPTTSAGATTPTMCVTSDAPVFRMFIKNNGNLGHIDGQLAIYLNFTGADGKPQQVKIAGLTVKSTAWTLTPPISFIQYISTPLKSGFANISFTIKPNDDHGNWQVDQVYVDPYMSR
jgi:hypothetical protein